MLHAGALGQWLPLQRHPASSVCWQCADYMGHLSAGTQPAGLGRLIGTRSLLDIAIRCHRNPGAVFVGVLPLELQGQPKACT